VAAPGKPDIRGEQRAELINDLAQGSLTHAELAAKFDRHPQAIAQFAVRNRGEIAVVQSRNNRDLRERLAEIPIADKGNRVAVAQQLREDLRSYLEDPNLDARLRNHYTKTIMALQRAVAEEMGDLRTHVEVAAPFRLGEVLAFGSDGQLHAVVDPPQ
jgi:hypothetical protein